MAAASPSPSPTPTPTLTPPSPSPPPPSLLVQGKCQCGDSHPYCAVNGWCYQSSISPHWDSAACKGTCEAPPADKPSINLLSPPGLLTPRPPPPSPPTPRPPPPSPPPPPPPPSSPLLATGRCQCGDNHPYCHVNGWCYQSSASPLWDYSCKGGCETQPPACEGGCETQPPDKPSIRLPNRTHLVFNHLPKCAGTELAAVLEECLPTGALTVVGEFARTSTSSQQRSFIVSSIREPCSAYLSLWAYGVAGLGKFREDCATPELYYPPDGNPSASLHADLFLSWLMTPARAVFQKRFDTSFPDPSAVDCWVRVEFLDTDLLHCLHAFEVPPLPPVDQLRPSHLSPTPDSHKHASHKHASPCPRGRRRAVGPWTGRRWRLACLACAAPASTWSAHRVARWMAQYEQSTLVGAAQRATRRCNRCGRGLRQVFRSTHRRTTRATPTLIRTPPASSCKSNRPSTVRLDTCGVPRAPTPPPQPSPLARPRPHPPWVPTVRTHPDPLPSPPHPYHPAVSRFVRRFSAAAREEHPPISRRSRAGQGALTSCGRWRLRQRIGTRGRKVENALTPGKYRCVGRRSSAI